MSPFLYCHCEYHRAETKFIFHEAHWKPKKENKNDAVKKQTKTNKQIEILSVMLEGRKRQTTDLYVL